ncbi:RICIN domain-containing protein [Reichenbachiella agarivorans]|uniref:RICIN domain-containing protein n=1 Tax=Reichenbachiella agarivorans TaxID=2979464 RepID=A0ABY6CRY4_9BACT|nr:discoidin domain-containing protein [Reichenbachiella agarivorans]UXP32609.1 RICIN domain-containing protein [Reichenbachiella agarivorans]
MKRKIYHSISTTIKATIREIGLFLVLITLGASLNAQTVVQSLSELQPYLKESNVHVKLAPGTYTVTAEDVANKLFESQTYTESNNSYFKVLLLVSGNGSTYDFTDVTIKVKTEVFRAYGNYDVYEVQITGNNNVLKNLTLFDDGSVDDNPTSGAVNIVIDGASNRVEGFHVTSTGSFPYGYGDAFGKGGSGNVIGHKKHSTCLVRGESNHVKNCTFIHRTYGHCIFMQAANNPLIEGCYVEGEVRSTDDMLAEEGTGSPADLVDFMTTWGYRLPPGHMMSLGEEGIRAYNAGETVIDGVHYSRGTSNVTVLNCTVKNMRGGITLAHATGSKYVEGCTIIGCEQGYALASGSVVNCKADAAYGPVYQSTYDNDRNFNADITIIPPVDPYYNGSKCVAYIGGSGHRVVLRGNEADVNPELKIQMGGYLQNQRFLSGEPSSQNYHTARDMTIYNLSGYEMDLPSASYNVTGITCGLITDEGTDNDVTVVTCEEACVNEPGVTPPSYATSGINYSLYEGDWDALPDFGSLSPALSGWSADLNVAATDDLSTYALVFDGFITIAEEGSYDFYISSDDASRLTIDGIEVINHSPATFEEVTGSICLEAGDHLINIAYVEKNSNETFTVAYEGSTVAKTTNLALLGIPDDAIVNLAYRGNATQSSIAYDGAPIRAVDGNTSGVFADNSVSHTNANSSYPWWQVDLGGSYAIGEIKIFNRTDCCSERLANFNVSVLESSGIIKYSQTVASLSQATLSINAEGAIGSIIRIQINGTGTLALAEVEVYEGTPSVGGGEFQMVKRSASLYAINGGAEVQAGDAISLLKHANHENLTWTEIDRGDGYFSYQKYGTEYCLHGGTENIEEQNVTLIECAESDVNQQWLKIGAGDGYYRLQKRGNNMVIDAGNGRSDGAKVFLGSLDVTDQNQQWKFESADLDNLQIDEEILSADLSDVEIIAYPNPVSTQLTLNVPVSVYDHLVMYNLDGRVVYRDQIPSDAKTLNVNFDSRRSGMYVVILSGKGAYKQVKVIKK